MAEIYFVSCVKRKREQAAPAEDLYTSTYFNASKAYAQSQSDYWYILSALHGLLEPGQVIEPYDLTLNDMGVRERRAWAERVVPQISEQTSPKDKLIFLTGNRYHEYLLEPLRTRGNTISMPMEGLRFGEKVQWLQQQNGNE